MSQVGVLRDESGRGFTLEADEVIIGRERSCTICFPAEDTGVSRRHARVIQGPGKSYMIEDLGSANGTLLDGQPLPSHQLIPLAPGSSIRVGQHTLLFQLEAGGETAAALAPAMPVVAAEPRAMVPRLNISWPNGQVQAVCSGGALVLGRSRECDVMIPWEAISRRHARVERTPEGYQVVDLDSRNHVWYQDRPVQRQLLRPGDIFTLGREVQVQVDWVRAEGKRGSGEAAYHFTPVSGKAEMTIGRSSGNDFVVPHPQVSRRHARLTVRQGQMFLEDLNSTHGTFVNGRRIQGLTPVSPNVEIRVGGQRIVLTQTYAGQTIIGSVREGGHIRLDGQRLWKMVGTSRKQKAILRDISLSILPGEFVSLIGVSGAGKSTLLHALSGYQPATQGAVFYNGDNYYAHFDSYRNSVGYVPQRDIIHMELPARRALLYAARLRFPSDTLPGEMEKRVDEVLRLLGLGDRGDVPVGNLSGGQQKRVSIAVELLTKPDLLFLDEPCSGLDPGYEKKMMIELRQMADLGQTIVLVTHNIQNINQCDLVAFLAYGGRLVYYGPPEQIGSYFEQEDPADIYTRLEGPPPPEALKKQHGQVKEEELSRNADKWRKRFLHSPLYHEYVEERQRTIPRRKATPGALPQRRANRTSGLRQFFILCHRYLEIMSRDSRNLVLLLLQAPILALLVGLIFKHGVFITERLPDANRGRALALIFLLSIISIWLGTSNSCREIVKELDIYKRERAVNLKLFPYVLSKVAVLSLFSIFQSVALLAIVAIFIKMPDIENLVPQFLLTLILTSLAGTTMGLLISAVSPNANRAITLVPLVLIPQIIFAGMILPLKDMGEFGKYMAKAMISRWSFVALGTIFDVERIQVMGKTAPVAHEGALQGPFDVSVPLYWLALLGFIVIFTGLTLYFQKKRDILK